MKQILTFLIFMTFFGSKLSSQDMVPLTLNVDLSAIEDFHEGGGAWVFMDAGWNEWYDMTDEDGDKIFTVTVEKPAGDMVPFRFSYQNGPDPNSNYTEEAVPVECSDENGFRSVMMPNHGENLEE